MTTVNPITTPVLNSPDDQPIRPNIYDAPTINDYSKPTRLTFAPETLVPYERNRRAANDGEVTAVHGAGEIRTVLVDEPETPGLLLRAYDDLRGRITTGNDRRNFGKSRKRTDEMIGTNGRTS